ncbi:MAG: hypothetical protein M3Q23_06480 [Actinomycetota bacterium]|nr:hypothetical protein [Actinomycetota bacterium]
MRRLLLIAPIACALSAASLLPAEAAGTPSDHFVRGTARIVDERTFVTFRTPYRLTDISSDGRRVAFIQSYGAEAGVIDLVNDRIRFFGPVDVSASGPVLFSPGGRAVLFRHRTTLRIFHLSTGRTTIAVRGVAPNTAWQWLGDGRIAFVDWDRRLLLARPGHTPRFTGITIPGLQSGRHHYDFSRILLGTVSVSPSGAAVLYTDGRCRAWLADLDTGTRHVVARRALVRPMSWSPQGSRFVLTTVPRSSPPGCLAGPPSAIDVMFDRHGKRLARVSRFRDALSTGHTFTWSTDGRWILIGVDPTGSAVAGYEYLLAASVRHRTVSMVVPDRLASPAFMGPGGWIMFSHYAEAEGASYGHEQGWVIVGRIVGG